MKTWIVLAVVMVAGAARADEKAKPAAPAKQKVMYNGRVVSDQWIDAQFKDCAPHIAKVNGKFYPFARGGDLIPNRPPAEGAAFTVHGPVIQMLDDTSALIEARTPDGDDINVRVGGLPPKKFTDGSRFSERAVFVGTYKYVTVTGASSTVQAYAIPAPLTKAEFIEALGGGLKLVKYVRIKGVLKAVPVP